MLAGTSIEINLWMGRKSSFKNSIEKINPLDTQPHGATIQLYTSGNATRCAFFAY
jgi:hypothetical protein